MNRPIRYDLRGSGLTAEQEREAQALLRSGVILIYPTDTLYAVGCSGLNGGALARLRKEKGREADKAWPLIVADLEQARSLTSRWPEAAERLAARFWPGPLTLVAPAASHLPVELLAGATTVAMRVPASALACRLAKIAGPLVSTSANLAGEPPCLTVDQALAAFPGAVLAIDVGPLDGAPSTIVDVTDPGGTIRLLREGRIARQQVEEVV